MQNNRWEYKPLSEVVEIHDTRRKPINAKERAKRIEGKDESSLFPYYGATGQVGYIDDYLTDGEYVLLGEDGAPFLDAFAKKAYIISGRAWVNNHAHVLRSKGDNRFLCYYLNHFDFHDYVSGTTRLKLTQEQMKKIPVPVLPIEEQQRIVARIEELFSQLDDAEATLQKTKAQLQIYRRAVLQEAFSFSNSRLVEMTDLCLDIRIGPFGTMLHKSDYTLNGVPVINPQHIKNGVIVPSQKNTISLMKAEELSSYRFQANDIVMGRRGEMGRTAPITTIEQGWICGTGSILFRLKPEYDAAYYSQILSSPTVVHFLEENATGTTMKNLNEGIVSSIPVPDIPRTKQVAIKAQLEERLSLCDSIEQTINTAMQQAKVMWHSILSKAFIE